jgi:hypothetical protein
MARGKGLNAAAWFAGASFAGRIDPAPATTVVPPAVPERKTVTLDDAQTWTLRQALETAGEVYNLRRQVPGMLQRVRQKLESEEAAILEVATLLEDAVLVTLVMKGGRTNG